MANENYANVKCLPECDETHAEDCPRFEAEKEYYRGAGARTRGEKP